MTTTTDGRDLAAPGGPAHPAGRQMEELSLDVQAKVLAGEVTSEKLASPAPIPNAIEERRNPYLIFTLPAEPQLICDCQMIQGSALKLREFLRAVPDARHRREAMTLLDRAVMVAMGGFHTKAAEVR